MRGPSVGWLSAEVDSEFPVLGGAQAEVRQPLGRVFQRWFLPWEAVRTIWPWSPIFSGLHDSVVSRGVPKSNQSRPCQTPPAWVLQLFFLPSQGWASEWGVPNFQFMHKERTQNCFSWWHPSQLPVQQPARGLAQRATWRFTEGAPTLERWRQGGNQGLRPSPCGKKKQAGGRQPQQFSWSEVKFRRPWDKDRAWAPSGWHQLPEAWTWGMSLRPGTAKYSYMLIKQTCHEDKESHAGKHPTRWS